MNKKLPAISIILLLTTISLTSISFAQAAGQGQWITSYQIEDSGTGLLLAEFDSATDVNQTYSAVLPGADIKITFTVNVMASGEGNLKLTSGLLKPSSGPYWELVSEDYDLGKDFTPNTQSALFNWVEGEFTITMYGKVPAQSTTSTSANKPINAVSLYGPSGGTALDKITIRATSAKMDTYLTLLGQSEEKLRSLEDSGVDQGFIDAYTNVLDVSQAVAEGGDVDNAIALLNGFDVPAPPSSTMQMLFLPVIGVTAALAIVFLVMFMRVRGKVSYFQLVVEDQIKDLEGLTLRAAKIDRTMSSSLESVKDRLKRLVGM